MSNPETKNMESAVEQSKPNDLKRVFKIDWQTPSERKNKKLKKRLNEAKKEAESNDRARVYYQNLSKLQTLASKVDQARITQLNDEVNRLDDVVERLESRRTNERSALLKAKRENAGMKILLEAERKKNEELKELLNLEREKETIVLVDVGIQATDQKNKTIEKNLQTRHYNLRKRH